MECDRLVLNFLHLFTNHYYNLLVGGQGKTKSERNKNVKVGPLFEHHLDLSGTRHAAFKRKRRRLFVYTHPPLSFDR